MTPRRPRDIGTAAETAVVRTLRPRGFPHAERRALRGTQDAGDITGTPGICWSVKGGTAARTASDGEIIRWLCELDKQTANAGADIGVLVIQRAAVGEANAHRWWAITRAYQYERVANRGGEWLSGFWFPLRMQLGDLCELLRWADYGTPREMDAAPASVTQPPGAGAEQQESLP